MRLIFFIILFGTGNGQRNDRDTSILSTREFTPSCKVQSKDEENQHIFLRIMMSSPRLGRYEVFLKKLKSH